MEPKTRKKLEQLLWRHTHKDFRGTINGERTVLHLSNQGGTHLVPISAFTDNELVAKLMDKKCTARWPDIKVTNFRHIRQFMVEGIRFYDVYDIIGPKTMGPWFELEEAKDHANFG